MKVTAKQARERFSEILDRAARGEEVVILCRGKPVARLVPARAAKPGLLPDLQKFRASIRAHRTTLTGQLLKEREKARY
jgi:prevent-host-death family protein